jgi:ABC-2 type transport system permease protein
MTLNKIIAIMEKEFDEIMKNKYILGSILLIPLLFSLLLPSALIAPAVFYPDTYLSSNETSYMGTAFGNGQGNQQSLIIFFITTVLPFFMMLPAILPTIIASYSIIGEKKNRTLEPLLAAPVTVYDILIGKALSAIIPALLATWASSVIFFGITESIIYIGLRQLIFPDMTTWAVGMLVLAPLLAFLGIMVALVISSRVNDPRVAQQISAIFIVPIMGLFIGQMSGFLFLDTKVLLGVVLVMFVIDVIVLNFSKSMFDREEILTRWK